MKHIKELDALRALAVAFVLISHAELPIRPLINKIPNGHIGVNLFFVLSGFLITSILLYQRQRAESEGTTKGVAVRNFYIRRVLRIFPAYYLTIALILVASKFIATGFKRPELLYSLTYTMNFYISAIQKWPRVTLHFWSLAVEEQFYLFWPFVVLFIRRSFLLPIFLGFICIGITFQLFYMHNIEYGYLLTYTCFDALGMGALLAWIMIYQPDKLPLLLKISSWLAVPCVAVVLAAAFMDGLIYPIRTFVSIPALWLVAFVMLHEGKAQHSFLMRICNNRVLQFLGRISYGLYLYHVPVFVLLTQWLTPRLIRSFGQSTLLSYAVAVACIFATVLLSWISWMVIEKPILRFKRFFTYSQKKQGSRAQAAVSKVPAI